MHGLADPGHIGLSRPTTLASALTEAVSRYKATRGSVQHHVRHQEVSGMGYRELSRMEIVEVVRRWQVGESQRAIARASGVARETVKKYLHAAEELGLAANGPPLTEDQVVRLVQVGRVVSAPRTWASPQADRLEPYREQITAWLQQEHFQVTRVRELLGQRGVHVRTPPWNASSGAWASNRAGDAAI